MEDSSRGLALEPSSVAHSRQAGAQVGALLGLGLGVVVELLLPRHEGSMNFFHAHAVIGPLAGAIGGAWIAPLARRRPFAGYLAMTVATFLLGVLLWPLVAIVLPFLTGELTCASMGARCRAIVGMAPADVLAYGVGKLVEWYHPAFMAFGFLSGAVSGGLPVLIGSAAWVYIIRSPAPSSRR